MISDQAFILYILSALVSIYGFGLFVWWWIRVGKVSAMYIYMTLFFFSNFVLMGTNAFTRYHRDLGTGFYFAIFEEWWWPARLYLYLAVLIAIAIHMSFRAFWIRKRYNTERDNK